LLECGEPDDQPVLGLSTWQYIYFYNGKSKMEKAQYLNKTGTGPSNTYLSVLPLRETFVGLLLIPTIGVGDVVCIICCCEFLHATVLLKRW